jgi:hypothetical protein
MAPRRKLHEDAPPSVNDQLDAECREAAGAAALEVLKRFRATSPAHLPLGLPRLVVDLVGLEAAAAWIRTRLAQAKRLGVGADFADAYVNDTLPPDQARLYHVERCETPIPPAGIRSG